MLNSGPLHAFQDRWFGFQDRLQGVMRQNMQVRERIVSKTKHTSADLIDYRWVRMVQACFRTVSDLLLTGSKPDSIHYVASTILSIVPALQLSGFYSFATGSDI